MSHFERNNRLISLSEMVVHGNITHKLDFVATIYINCHYYFSVYRRYNSPYNYIIEDVHGDLHLHQDHTLRKSLQNVLCLSDKDSHKIYTLNALSYKHNGPVQTMPVDIADMRWSQVQAEYCAINVNFGGVLEDYHSVEVEVPHSVSEPVIKQEETKKELPKQETSSETNVGNIQLNITIPAINEEELLRKWDSPRQSRRYSDVVRSGGCLPDCYCRVDEEYKEFEDDEEDTEYEYEYEYKDEKKRKVDDDTKYTILRNGTKIRKLNT
jgi:hypothetical protein